MELDADNTAVTWCKLKMGLNLSAWHRGPQIKGELTSVSPHFIAFVVSNLSLATRHYYGNVSGKYLTYEIRHAWALLRIVDGGGLGMEDKIDLVVKYLVMATDLMMKVTGHEQLQKPTLIVDIDFEGQKEWFERVSQEHSSLRSDWARYSFLAAPSA